MQIQLTEGLEWMPQVVICFKFSNFAYANTVKFENTFTLT